MFSDMKTRIRFFGFLLSLVLHAAFVWFLYGPGIERSTPVTVDIEYFEAPAQIVKEASSQSGSPSRTGKRISRQNLFPSSSPISKPGQPTPTLDRGLGSIDDDGQYIEAMTDAFGDNAEWSFLHYLHQKVEEELSFDRLLAEWGHFGTVYVEFWVDDQGLLLPNRIRVVADDSILKVHSLRALRRALAKPFAETKWNRSKESIKVHAKFDYLSGELRIGKQRAFSKRKLVFQRKGFSGRVPTDFWEQMGQGFSDSVQFTETELSKKYGGGGVSVDVLALVDSWKKRNKKVKQIYRGFDPFDDYRKDPDYNL